MSWLQVNGNTLQRKGYHKLRLAFSIASAWGMHGHSCTMICQNSPFQSHSQHINLFYSNQSQGSWQFVESNYLVSIFAEGCCIFGLAESTASSLTDEQLSSVYYQGFTLRSHYCHSYCWQEWHQRDLYVNFYPYALRNSMLFLFRGWGLNLIEQFLNWKVLKITQTRP